MGPYGLECCAALIVLSCVLTAAIAEEERREKDKLENPDVPQKYQWYVSPRLGRKKKNLSPFEENYELSSTLDKEQLEAIFDNIQEAPWNTYTITEGKRNSVNFVPRLGRELIEDGESDAIWLYDTDLNRELVTRKSPPFTPRLGRRSSNTNYHFDPRLGKRNSNFQKQLL